MSLLFFSLISPCFSQEGEQRVLKFRKEVKDLVANVSGFQTGKIGNIELINFKEVLVSDSTFKVVSFVIYFPSTKNGVERKVSHKGSLIYPDVRAALLNLNAKSQIEIQEIVVVSSDGSRRVLAPLVFRVYREDIEITQDTLAKPMN